MAVECVLSVEKREYRALYEVIATRWRVRAVRALLPISAAIAAVVALLVKMPLFWGLLLLLYSVFALLWYAFFPQFQAWEAYRHRNTAVEVAAFTYRFEETALHILHPVQPLEVQYADITECVETETHIILFTGKRVFCVAKDTIVQGTAEQLCTLLKEHTVCPFKTVKTDKADRRRAVQALVTAVAAVVFTIGICGATYIHRPVTVEDMEHSITLSLPRFMTQQDSLLYAGNGIEVQVEYITKDTMRQHIDTVWDVAAVNVANYADYMKKSELVQPKGEWVAVSEAEYYMSYADGADYRYTVLHGDHDGIWIVWFRCPGERQDTYYNRFDDWRGDIQYQ